MKLTALLCLACLAAAPSLHAQTTAPVKGAVVGMPIYAADGAKIGQVTNVATYRGKQSMIGEVGLRLGFGTRRVLIPDTLATVQNDRVVLTITSDQVSQILKAAK